MLVFGRKQQTQTMRDRIIVFNEDAKTCEIHPVYTETEEVVSGGPYTIPKADLDLRLSKHGKVFVLRAPTRIVELTEHLARVERNTIIRQIAQYDRPMEDTRTDWMKIFLVAALVLVAAIAAAS